jgi:hypothetical protein
MVPERGAGSRKRLGLNLRFLETGPMKAPRGGASARGAGSLFQPENLSTVLEGGTGS